MIDLTKEINKNFNNKYDFLRLLEVNYDKSQFCCTIIFLFPQTVTEITDDMREEIYSFLNNYLNLNAKLIIKYKKSFLDEKIIKDSVFNFFAKNNLSLFNNITKDNILVKKDIYINVTLSMPNELIEYIQANKIHNTLKLYLEKEFISEFYINLQVNSQILDDSILQQRKDNLEFPVLQKIKRYEVFHPENLLGRSISPFPELIKEQKGEKSQVILSGKISNIAKKEYKSKRNKNKDELNYFYTFSLSDTTGNISCIHFSTKSNEAKLDMLSEELPYLFQGDLRNNSFGKLTYYIRYINACEFSVNEVKKAQEEKKEQVVLTDTYTYVFPQKYEVTSQSNMFSTENYTDLIMHNDIVVFDVETTGLDADNCEIIEIGACKIVKGVITETFQSLIKPKSTITETITEITGIDNEMVKDAYNVNQVLADFICFCKGCVLSGYNVGFDMKFIQNAAKNLKYTFDNRVEDTMAIAREKVFLKKYTLSNVAKNLDVSLKNAHRALNDAIATAKVLLKLNIV